MQPRRTNSGTFKQRLFTLRIIFAALLLGQLLFLIIVLFGLLPHEGSGRGMQKVYALVDWGMLTGTVPIVFAARMIIFGASRGPIGIPMNKYITGNLIFWAGCTAVTFASLDIAHLTALPMPGMLIAAVAILLQLATFPWARNVAAQ